MTKTELIQGVQERLDCTKTDALIHEEKVAISKFGSFEVRQRNEKLCKNPQTQELMIVPASKAPVFKASKTLKDAVNQK